MIKIGLTGNIGSGKSTVSRIFATLGIPVFYADDEAKALYLLDEVKEKLQFYFSDTIFDETGKVKFDTIAALVFSNKDKLKQLTNILHPLVFENYHKWLDEKSYAKYSLHESAIIFEYGQQKYFDKTICVTAPTELRTQRVIARDKTSLLRIEQRIDNQMNESEKIKLSDFIISNAENSFLIPQVLHLDKIFKTNL